MADVAGDAIDDPAEHVEHAGIRVPKEVMLPNPLAIGVTLGGLFLDVVAPRPKPRAGVPSGNLSLGAVSRTPRRRPDPEEQEGTSIASGSPSGRALLR
jgi:hypothetical protein